MDIGITPVQEIPGSYDVPFCRFIEYTIKAPSAMHGFIDKSNMLRKGIDKSNLLRKGWG